MRILMALVLSALTSPMALAHKHEGWGCHSHGMKGHGFPDPLRQGTLADRRSGHCAPPRSVDEGRLR